MDSENKLSPVNLFFISYEPKKVENKTPIIFVHGIMSSPYCWNKVKSKICENTGRKGYAICLRNHGSSDKSEDMSVPHMAEDVKYFMRKEGISKAILIGHSLGGLVALALAFSNPVMCEKIIIEEMKLAVSENESRFWEFKSILELAAGSLKEFPASTSESIAQKKLQHLFTYAWSKKPTGKAYSRPMTPLIPFYKDKSGNFVWEINIDAAIKVFGNVGNFQIPLNEDNVYSGEALFIAAEYSAFEVLKQKELIQKHIPNSQFVCAEGVYHSCHLEKPGEYVDLVLKFLVP